MDKFRKWWNNRKRASRWVIVLCFILGVLLSALFRYVQQDDVVVNRKFYENHVDDAARMSYIEFVQAMEDGLVDDVYYNTTREYMLITMWNDESKGTEDYDYELADCRRVLYPAGEDFRENMLKYDIDLILVKNETTSSEIRMLIFSFLPIIVMLLCLMKISSRLSYANDVKAEDIIQKSDVVLGDIIGHEEILDELKLIIEIIRNPALGKEVGCRLPHGILFSGPAGVGKTMIAKAISNEAGVPFLSMNGADFQELYVGNGARHVRQLFKIARDHAPCIVFVDEFDAIGTRRDSTQSHGEDTKTINAILKEMDGFKPLEGVFVIAATNFPDKLDSAIKRSGRFDREVVIPSPKDWKVRVDMFKHYLSDKRVMDDIDIESLAKSVAGFTGADIASVCNEAGLVALSHGKSVIDYDCIEEAIGRKVFKGSYSKSDVNEKDKKVVAYHEAGHAVMSLLVKRPVSRVSIRGTTSGVGGAVFNEEIDSQFYTAGDIRNMLKILYAGQTSEWIKFKRITTGASNDIEKATSIMVDYIGTYGFSRSFGVVNAKVLIQNGIEVDFTESLHELMNGVVEETYSELNDNYDMVIELAERLLEVGSMSGSEIDEFLGITS